MSDFYKAYEKLIPIVVLGKRFEVPENNLLLRQMQFVAPDIGFGKYCWNAECRYCEISYRLRPEGPEVNGLACAVSGQPGLRVTKAALEIRYNMADALAGAPAADD
jgi:hypothetical protein